ncbi:hypothetical protein ACFFGH_09960 [Lysobacter korlensis]|uniref:Uncharacterized protein n=1 Tax=Lysobacter korlensis TaxID=553636 RepID=A0ABV6RQG2_9GAMM
MRKPITPAMHGAIDYGMSALLLAAPWALKLSRKSAITFNGFAAAQAGVTALSNQPLAAKQLIPWHVHRTIDAAAVPAQLAVPLATGVAREPKARALWIGTLVALVAVFALTDWDARD